MIKIGFSTNSWHPISILIRWWTQSEVSHVFVLYDDEQLGIPMVAEVVLNGFRVIPYAKFLRDNTIICVVEPKHDLSAGLKKVAAWLGRPFDFKALLGFCDLFKGFVQHPFDNPKELLCSELVIRMLREAGYPGAKRLNPKTTSPQELLEFLS